MLDIKQFTPQAMVELKPLLALQKFRSNDYTLCGLYMWRDYFGQRYCIAEGMLVCVYDYFGSGFCYSWPVGPGDETAAIKAIERDAMERGVPLRFCCVPKEYVGRLTELFGEPIEVTSYREWADYLYPYENFLGYHGKKLVTPRNHCNRFVRDNPQYEYLPLTKELAPRAKQFLKDNESILKKPVPLAEEDYRRAYEMIDLAELFGFTGGLLATDGKTIGFTLGEAIADTLYVHIEKALTQYSGVYPMLASLYAKQNACEELRFINREDDTGDEGLRKSKLEYRPCELIEKYVVEFPRR